MLSVTAFQDSSFAEPYKAALSHARTFTLFRRRRQSIRTNNRRVPADDDAQNRENPVCARTCESSHSLCTSHRSDRIRGFFVSLCCSPRLLSPCSAGRRTHKPLLEGTRYPGLIRLTCTSQHQCEKWLHSAEKCRVYFRLCFVIGCVCKSRYGGVHRVQLVQEVRVNRMRPL